MIVVSQLSLYSQSKFSWLFWRTLKTPDKHSWTKFSCLLPFPMVASLPLSLVLGFLFPTTRTYEPKRFRYTSKRKNSLNSLTSALPLVHLSHLISNQLRLLPQLQPRSSCFFGIYILAQAHHYTSLWQSQVKLPDLPGLHQKPSFLGPPNNNVPMSSGNSQRQSPLTQHPVT